MNKILQFIKALNCGIFRGAIQKFFRRLRGSVVNRNIKTSTGDIKNKFLSLDSQTYNIKVIFFHLVTLLLLIKL